MSENHEASLSQAPTGTGDRVLVSWSDAPWLPAGGRADVVVAGPDAAPPFPTCLARVLVTSGGRILVVPRPDGRGPDIPTLRVEGQPTGAVVRDLVGRTLDGPWPTTLLGYVRNVVTAPDSTYGWPTPEAHFAVWHCPVPQDHPVRGTWLGWAGAEAELGQRHWWPLAAHLRGDRP